MKKINLFILMTMLSFSIHCQTHWTKHPGNPVMQGSSGEWDEKLSYIGSVILYNDQYHMWYVAATSERGTIGHATSPDGITWTKDLNNPVFGKGDPGSWDDGIARCGDVTLVNDTLHMWYSGSKEDYQQSGIGHATSTDGVNWTRDSANPVLTVEVEGSWDYEWIWIDEVVYDGTEYHMWYQAADFDSTNNNWIGHATSTDGSVWIRDPLNPVLKSGNTGEWDYPIVSFPEVVYDGSIFYMWYAGGTYTNNHIRDIGYATSPDGSNWTKFSENPVLEKGAAGSWDDITIFSGCVIDSAGIKYEMWYMGQNGNSRAFGYAESPITVGTGVYYSDQLIIFPNPTDGLVKIRCVEPGEHVIEITSLNGQLIYGEEMKGATLQLDLSSFQKGIYFITIRSKDFIATRKINKL